MLVKFIGNFMILKFDFPNFIQLLKQSDKTRRLEIR